MNTVINNQISEDYFLHRIKPDYQKEANVLLAITGVLNSLSGKYTLAIISCTMEPIALSTMNTQKCHYQASVINQDDVVVDTFNYEGSPNQCFEYLAHCFEVFLTKHEDQIYLKQHDELIQDKMLVTDVCQSPQVLIDNKSSLSVVQEDVDTWINTLGVRYFSELTNLSNLIEEVGEVARLIGREYGEQSFKKGEKPECIKTAIADELSDVLFIVVCLANQLDINLDDAFAKNMNKKTNRDTTRHQNNSKLK